jgi:hypothetical protein
VLRNVKEALKEKSQSCDEKTNVKPLHYPIRPFNGYDLEPQERERMGIVGHVTKAELSQAATQ